LLPNQQNNAICTLKGSLLRLKFLTDLDLSNNQLRDLRKLLQGLARLRFLQQLNLQVGLAQQTCMWGSTLVSSYLIFYCTAHMFKCKP
jgi:hypothetical protein